MLLFEERQPTFLEYEFRQSIWRGYQRILHSASQLGQLEPVECILELLGDPQAITFHHRGGTHTFRMPLVAVSCRPINAPLESHFNNPETALSVYKRRLHTEERETPQAKSHTAVIEAIQVAKLDNTKFLFQCRSGVHYPSPRFFEWDIKENWNASKPVDLQSQKHWFFGESIQQLPIELRRMDSLIRLTFPVFGPQGGNRPEPLAVQNSSGPEARGVNPPRESLSVMVLIGLVLGLDDKPTSALPDCCDTHCLKHSGIDNLTLRDSIRRLADVVITEVPHYYSRVQHGRHQRGDVIAPEWVTPNERDTLHSAVDDMHREVIRLASQVNVKAWDASRNGYKMVMALRVLNDRYEQCLSYRLSTFNLNALDDSFSDLQTWRDLYRQRLKQHQGVLEGKLNLEVSDLVRTVERKIDELFGAEDDTGKCKQKLAKKIEEEQYRSRRTPGDSVMRLGHPEIIRHWLRDPRANKFQDYPKVLLAWESTSLPEEIYYGPLVNGAVPVGVCAIDSELLLYCSANDLQELIDRKSQRLHHILCEREMDNARDIFRAALEKEGPSEKALHAIVRGLRLAAFYQFPNVEDFFVKLVASPLTHLKGGAWSRPRRHGTGTQWVSWQADPVTRAEQTNVELIRREPHLRNPQDHADVDFLDKYMMTIESSNFDKFFDKVGIHRITFDMAKGLSLVLLVRNGQHSEIVNELLERTLSKWENVLAQHASLATKAAAESAEEVYDAFVSYNRKDRDEVKNIVDRLKQEGISVWIDYEQVMPGERWKHRLAEIIRSCRKCVTCLGQDIGPTQKIEIRRSLEKEFEYEGCVIPAILSNSKWSTEELPPEIEDLHAVDFAGNFEFSLAQLKAGIVGTVDP